jgi:hypothetical protein
MLFSLILVRLGTRHLAGGTLLLLLAGCGGPDLLLPGDGIPAQLRAVSGDGQTAVAGTPVRNPLVVEALDVSGVPVPGAVIVFRFVDPPRGADIAPPTPTTDDSGRAAVEVILGAPAGDQPVEARLADPERDLSVRFSLTAIQPNDGDGGGDDEGDDDPPPEDGPDNGGNAGGDDDGDGEGNDDGGGGRGGDDDGNDDRGDDDDDGGGPGDDDGKDDDGGKGEGGEGRDEDRDDEDKDDEDNSGEGSGDDEDDEDRDDDDHGDDDRGHGD